MKKTISILIGVVFSVVQLIISLFSTENNKIIIIICTLVFVIIWILYTLFSDAIDSFICRLIGYNTDPHTPKYIVNFFYNRIVPSVYSLASDTSMLCDKYVDKYGDKFIINNLYNSWCIAIDFILYDCVSNDNINTKIICKNSNQSATSFRNEKIDENLLISIVNVLDEFGKMNELKLNIKPDYVYYKEKQKKLCEIFK